MDQVKVIITQRPGDLQASLNEAFDLGYTEIKGVYFNGQAAVAILTFGRNSKPAQVSTAKLEERLKGKSKEEAPDKEPVKDELVSEVK